MELEIIIPVRNNTGRIYRLLATLARQLKPLNAHGVAVRVGICDDCSDDETPDALARWIGDRAELGESWWRLVRRDSWGCCGGARNTLLDSSRADWVMFADADDDFEDGALEKIYFKCYHADKVDCIIYGFRKIEKDGEKVWLPTFEDKTKDYALAPVGVWIKAVRREIVGRFAEGVFCEDCAWWFELADRLDRVETIEEALYIYDRRASSFSEAIASFQHNPKTLEDLAFNDTLVKAGMSDRAPSDSLRNLAALYDLRRKLKRPWVRCALLNRIHHDYLSILSGRWSF